jgi:hypothetical protein
MFFYWSFMKWQYLYGAMCQHIVMWSNGMLVGTHLMETSKCISHQVTQFFVGKTCATLSFYVVDYETVWKSKLWHFFFNLKFYSNETNKGIIL